MEPIKEADIARLWTEHFRKRQYDAEAGGYCLRLALLIIEKTHSESAKGECSDKTQHMLKRLGVPKEQFYQVLADAGISY